MQSYYPTYSYAHTSIINLPTGYYMQELCTYEYICIYKVNNMSLYYIRIYVYIMCDNTFHLHYIELLCKCIHC